MRFRFIHAEKAVFPVRAMCRVLGVSRQGYYQFVQRGESERARRDHVLHEQIEKSHKESRGTYGSRRVTEDLQQQGVKVGRRRIERLMKEGNIQGVQPRRFRTTTKSNPAHRYEDNLLNRDFDVSKPNDVWAADITYIRTHQGWVYLAIVIDLYSRRIVGWAVDDSMPKELALRAYRNAVLTCGSSPRMHHSDRGSQYTSEGYRQALAHNQVSVSMSRKGDCWDNAPTESFFATLKRELIYRQAWDDRSTLRAALFDYIEVFYNRARLHSSLDYDTPLAYETKYNLANAA